MNEICDDGNMVDGDGCSSTCQGDAAILICKIVHNETGDSVDGSEVPGEFFSISTSFGDFNWTTPLAYNEDLTITTTPDAMCINVTGLLNGNYTYDMESYPTDIWEAPRYYDRLDENVVVNVNAQGAFREYNVHQRSDGEIQLTDGYEVFAILNEYCSDRDGDRVCDEVDNCPDTPNPNQEDADNDGVGDVCDMCPGTPANAPVDPMGCSQVQFCAKQVWCGAACDNADWLGNNFNYVNNLVHNDCKTVVVDIEGIPYPRCKAVEYICPIT